MEGTKRTRIYILEIYWAMLGLFNSTFKHDLIMSIPVSSLEHDVGSGYCDG